jgi:hypothetical protein
MGLDTKTYWFSDRQLQCDFDFESLRRQSEMIVKRWQLRVSWVSRRQPARIWTWEQRNWIEELRYQNYWMPLSGVELRNWGIRIIERSSVELNWGTEASELLSAAQWSWIEELRHQNYWVPLSGVELRNWGVRIVECRSVELNWETEASELLSAVQLRVESPAVKRRFLCDISSV